jgi:hypothetical protein
MAAKQDGNTTPPACADYEIYAKTRKGARKNRSEVSESYFQLSSSLSSCQNIVSCLLGKHDSN